MSFNDNDAVAAYFKGIIAATFGVSPIEIAAEWQIDAVKECASKLKEAEIDHSPISYAEKQEIKRRWESWLEAYAQGFKDELRRRGRLI